MQKITWPDGTSCSVSTPEEFLLKTYDSGFVRRPPGLFGKKLAVHRAKRVLARRCKVWTARKVDPNLGDGEFLKALDAAGFIKVEDQEETTR